MRATTTKKVCFDEYHNRIPNELKERAIECVTRIRDSVHFDSS